MKNRYVQVQNVTSLAARKNTGTSNGVIDSVLLEAGQPGGDIVGENVVYLELGVDWTSSRSKVRLKSENGRQETEWATGGDRGWGGRKKCLGGFSRNIMELSRSSQPESLKAPIFFAIL